MKPLIDWETTLRQILKEFSCQTAALHRTLDPASQTLTLVHQIGIPTALLQKISEIPFGKGIAGAAASTRLPVELCNLQQDLGKVAIPSARQTGIAGSIAVPIFALHEDRVIGTLGIGKFIPYEFTAHEKLALAAHALRIAGYFDQEPN